MKDLKIRGLEHFIAQQRSISSWSDETAALFAAETEEVAFDRDEPVFREGERERYVWFVKTGLVRAYIEREGRDRTLWFASDGEIVNFAYRPVSVYSVQPVEDSVLLRVPAAVLKRLISEQPELAAWGVRLLEYYLQEYENYFINDSWSDARAQYEALMRTRPELFQKVPLKHIASYLQITPQSLSRIRSKIR